MNPTPAVILLRETPCKDDADAVREIVSSTGYFHDHEIEVAVELVRQRLAQGPASGYSFLFADLAGGPIAYACYGPIACTLDSYDLYWIVVHARHRRRGLGRLLLGEAERRIRSAGGRRVYVETSARDPYLPTRRFYEACGYSTEARLRDFYAPGDDKLIYVKALNG